MMLVHISDPTVAVAGKAGCTLYSPLLESVNTLDNFVIVILWSLFSSPNIVSLTIFAEVDGSESKRFLFFMGLLLQETIILAVRCPLVHDFIKHF